MPNDEILFLFHEERIELVDLVVQQHHELLLRLAVLERSVQHCWRRRNQSHQLLQVLVGQELVPPPGQGFLNLLLQPLPKLHQWWT